MRRTGVQGDGIMDPEGSSREQLAEQARSQPRARVRARQTAVARVAAAQARLRAGLADDPVVLRETARRLLALGGPALLETLLPGAPCWPAS
ncbi:MAG: hypothetical protein KatS3mg102_1928 [Planctomycetota bacterium]|nr:MAG: hypothetical protein KatS3mg102_1928 [Planctomycetota bacterium]